MTTHDGAATRRDAAALISVGFGFPGMRKTGLPGFSGAFGFGAIAELAVLDRWNPGTGNPETSAIDFLEVGANSQPNDDSPLQLAERAADRAAAAANLAAPDPVQSTNPVDDPEERLAIFRAVSNIVTTRSDVFLAWLVLRGYDPEPTERIPVTGTGNVALQQMDLQDTPFRPAYESRWLAVLDRSNVRRPTDRARVVLLIELPRATP